MDLNDPSVSVQIISSRINPDTINKYFLSVNTDQVILHRDKYQFHVSRLVRVMLLTARKCFIRPNGTIDPST